MLEHVLASLPAVPDPDGRIVHGFAHNEDAVIVRGLPAGMAMVQTVDVLTPIGNNPRLFGQVAAANALSDVYAMGGEPWCAMNIVAFPSATLPLTMLSDILCGAIDKIIEAGAVLAGGHTLDDDEIKFGLSVTGMIDPARVAGNSGLRPGNTLILTKPLGTGVLATAIKANWPNQDTLENELYHWATRLNHHAAQVIRDMNLKTATDITGFGLGGHLLEMARASGVRACLELAALPFMEHVPSLAEDGLIPAGSYANRQHCASRTHIAEGADSLRAILTFDAQTSGGLLLAVPQERQDEAQERLAALGEPAWIVGHIEALPVDSREQLILA